jgi:endonuclease/exonuclease/phosphatase family metal-dependent hydrolase
MLKKIMILVGFLIIIMPVVAFAENSSINPPINSGDQEIASNQEDNSALAAPLEAKNPNGVIPLKVMTFNIHSAINWYGKLDVEGLAHFIEEVNPDIIGLQEVDLGWSSLTNFEDIPAKLGERLHMDYAFSASRERNNGFFGNLILSKYPIVQQWTKVMPGSLEPRSFVFIQLLIKGQRINFLTTHLGLSVSDRLEQVSSILDFVNRLRGPLIITGDFNGNDNDPAVTQIKRYLFDLQSMSEFKDSGTFRSKDGSIYPGSKMDYILATPEFSLSSMKIGLDNFVSDHVPLIAELTLNLN